MQTETEKIVPASWEPAWSHNFFSGPQNQPPAHTQVDIQRLPNTIRSTTTWEQQKPTSCEHRGRRGTCAKFAEHSSLVTPPAPSFETIQTNVAFQNHRDTMQHIVSMKTHTLSKHAASPSFEAAAIRTRWLSA